MAIVSAIKDLYGKDSDQARKIYSELFYYFDGLVNTVISQSQHPAGIVASPINLIDNYSVFIGEDGQYILPINMEEVHEIGLVKYDILGLKNIGIIKKTCEYAHIPYPRAHEIDWNDEAVYADMVKSPIGIFQFEGNYAFELLQRFGVKSIDDMSLVNASLRPSGESYRDRLMEHKSNKNPSELIDNLLEPSLGYLVYQEQTIQFLQQICGLTGSEADNVRRAIGRKQIDRLQKALPQILEGYCNMSDKPRDIAEEEAKAFLQIIEDSSSYQFGYNHSTGYSMLGYLCAYMRYYYPKEFVCAFLNCAKDTVDIANGTMLANELNITINMPLFRKSLDEFFCDDTNRAIYKGLASIKSIGKNTGSELYALKDNQYESFIDLLYDIKAHTTVNVTQLEKLIKINFFQEFGNINQLLYAVELFNKYGTCKTLKKDKLTPTEIPLVRKHATKETDKQFSGIDNLAIIKELFNTNHYTTTSQEKAVHQIKLLGYTDITEEGNPYCVVVNSEKNKYGTPFVTLYCLHSGNIKQFKADKNYFNQFPLEQGDIVKIALKSKDKKRKDENGKWYTDGQETVLIAWSKK